jgi:hypothetical protein
LQKTDPAPMEKAVKTAKDTDYIAFCKKYAAGARIAHKKYGEGTVLSEEAGYILVRFADGKHGKFSLAVLYEKSLTE